MKRLLLGIAIALAILGGWLAATRFGRTPKQEAPTEATAEGQQAQPAAVATIASGPSSAPASKRLPGELILRGYAQTNQSPQEDLTLMSHLMENFTLLLKSAANRPLSANEDWAAALRGRNAARERFLPDESPAFNATGQIVDRWGTPLFFHALGGGRYELRSAGPDGKMWTEDDIHRNADGSFRRGAGLLASSLVDAARRRPVETANQALARGLK